MIKKKECEESDIKAVDSGEEKERAQQGQFGFVPAQGQGGKRKFRYVESSEVAKGCKLCK